MVILEFADCKTTNFSINYQTDLSDALGRVCVPETMVRP